ncbi:MAG: hypothetical protein Q9181_004678 [Wetmoreana brouardii]
MQRYTSFARRSSRRAEDGKVSGNGILRYRTIYDSQEAQSEKIIGECEKKGPLLRIGMIVKAKRKDVSPLASQAYRAHTRTPPDSQ